jgi:hypothetical protein
MRNLVLALLLVWTTSAQAFFSVFDYSFEVPEERVTTVALNLWEQPTAHFDCLQAFHPVVQVFYTLNMTILPTCAMWWKNTSEMYRCDIYALPNLPDTWIGHEIRHCFDLDFHNLIGL